jgi:hypothetical protein
MAPLKQPFSSFGILSNPNLWEAKYDIQLLDRVGHTGLLIPELYRQNLTNIQYVFYCY